MKKVTTLLILPLLLGFSAFSQRYYNQLYSNSGSFAAGSIVEVKDGYIIVADSFAPINREMVIIRTTTNGNLVWQKIIGVFPQVTNGCKLIAEKNGFFVSANMKDSSNSNNFDILLLRCNDTGAVIWQKRYGGTKFDAARDVKKTIDGGYILVGATSSYGSGLQNVYVVKTDSLGNKQWDDVFGGSKIQDANSVALTSDKGYIISGSSNSFSSSYDHYVIKIDSLGNKQWEKTYGTPYDDYGGAIIKSKDNNYLFATASPNSAGKTYAKLMKLNQDGNIIFIKNYSYGNYSSFITAPVENNDGTIVIAAIYDPKPSSVDAGYLLKVNAVGDTIWSRTYSPRNDVPATIYDLKSTMDNGFIFCGSGWDVSKKQRAWVVKTDCMGNDSIHYAPQKGCCNLYAANVVSNKTNYTFCKGDSEMLTVQPAYNSYQWSTGATTQSIKVKQGGNYMVTITNANSCTLGVQPTVVQVDTMPAPVVSIKNKDTLQSNYAIGSRWYRNGQLITTAIGPIYATGGVGGTYTVVVSNTCGTGTSQVFNYTGINELESSKFESLKVWPNPVTSGELHIEGLKNDNFIEVYNLLGQRSPTPTLPGGEGMRLDLSGLMKGIYFLKLQSAGKQQVFKIIVQ